jgi:hypothetical protein
MLHSNKGELKMSKLVLRDGKQIDVYDLTKTMTRQNLADILSDWLNMGFKEYLDGVALGKVLKSENRTIQGVIIRFCLGVIIGLSKDTEYTDARN